MTTTAAKDIAEDVAKDIAEVRAAAAKAAAAESTAAHAALFKGRMTVLIVCRALLRVGQDFVGFLDLFEFGFRFFVTRIAIGVKLHRQAFIRLFNFTFVCGFGDA